MEKPHLPWHMSRRELCHFPDSPTQAGCPAHLPQRGLKSTSVCHLLISTWKPHLQAESSSLTGGVHFKFVTSFNLQEDHRSCQLLQPGLFWSLVITV